MKTNAITTINNIEIQIIKTEQETLVPIKPICTALGIDFSSQYAKIKTDEDLCSVVRLTSAIGADGKRHKMTCLPLRYIFGWLFTINPENVAEEASPNVRRYRMQCYDAFYEPFARKVQRLEAIESSFERTIALQQEYANLQIKSPKTGEDFDRYLQIESDMKTETALRKQLTNDSLENVRTLFDE